MAVHSHDSPMVSSNWGLVVLVTSAEIQRFDVLASFMGVAGCCAILRVQ